MDAVVSGGEDASIRIWDKSDGGTFQLIHSFEIFTSRVNIIHAFRLPEIERERERGREGKEVICAGTADGTAFIYSLGDLQVEKVITLDSVEFSPRVYFLKN